MATRRSLPSSSLISAEALARFGQAFNPTLESSALETRGQFLKAFPAKKLLTLQIDEYVIGKGSDTFCYYVESKTRAWAAIQGATALKFGVYFGVLGSDKKRRYRSSKKFSDKPGLAFKEVRNALCQLLALGKETTLDFSAIDANPLSPMFKAKILSLYYPEKFIGVCSTDHLAKLAEIFAFGRHSSPSATQHRVMSVKNGNPITSEWSNPKFMQFLYHTHKLKEETDSASDSTPPKLAKRHKTVDFNELRKAWQEIGEASEEYAWKYEERRLTGAGLEHLIAKMKDRRDQPGHGYDFETFSSAATLRFVEVKTVAKIRGGGHRCFLSETEFAVSQSAEHSSEYYFYFVSLDSNGEPCKVTPVLALDHYQRAERRPVAFELRFELPD